MIVICAVALYDPGQICGGVRSVDGECVPTKRKALQRDKAIANISADLSSKEWAAQYETIQHDYYYGCMIATESQSDQVGASGRCLDCGADLASTAPWKKRCFDCWLTWKYPSTLDSDRKCIDCGEDMSGVEKWKVRCLSCWKGHKTV